MLSESAAQLNYLLIRDCSFVQAAETQQERCLSGCYHVLQAFLRVGVLQHRILHLLGAVLNDLAVRLGSHVFSPNAHDIIDWECPNSSKCERFSTMQYHSTEPATAKDGS